MGPTAALAVVAAACTSIGDLTPDTNQPPDLTEPSTAVTTASIESAGSPEQTCARLEIAMSEMHEDLNAALAGLEVLDSEGMPDAEGFAVFVGPVVAFYEALGEIAEHAPSEVASDLSRLAGWAEPVKSAMESGNVAAMEGLDETDGVAESAAAVDAWARARCDISTSLEPGSLVSSAFTSAIFAGLGEGQSGLDDELEVLDGVVMAERSSQVYGDDPELDALWDRCQTDDDSCDELYWQTFGMYELFAETCGGRAAFRPNAGGSCADRMAAAGRESLGDDPYLDSLWAGCDGGDGFACDALASSAPVGSDYELFGATCGARHGDLGPRTCAEPDEPFGYGDDPDLDSLWERCSAGDASSCNQLWFDSPIGSAYEAMGDACGALVDRGRDCSLPAELLGGPVG